MKRNDIDSMQINNLNLVLSEKKSLFGNLSFNIPANRVVWIRGEPGAGKSTLLRVFSGLVLPTSGEYLINHEIVSEMSFEEFLPYRCNIGYGFDYGGLINNRTILENLLLAHEYHSFDFGFPAEFINRLDFYIKEFGLEDVKYSRPSLILGGLRKAACVARAFVHDPAVILLDEPTVGLQSQTVINLKKIILSKISQSRKSFTIIASSNSQFMEALDPVIIDLKLDDKNNMKDIQLTEGVA